MSRVIFTAKVASMTFLGAAGADLVENHSISVATVGAVLGVVIPAAWIVSNKLTKLEDAVRQHAEALKSLPCQHPDCPSKRR